MGPFIGRQAGQTRVWLTIISDAVMYFAGLQDGQDEGRPETSRQPRKNTGPARRGGGKVLALCRNSLSPEVAVGQFDCGEPAEYLGQLWIGLSLGQRRIDRGTIDFALQVDAVAPQRLGYSSRFQSTMPFISVLP